MRVAYFSPLPPSTSGIADYSALLVPALEQFVEVELVRPGRTRPVAGADVALYHVGNDPDQHAWIVDALRRRPGVVVLHDYVVHHLVAGLTIGRKDGHAYLAAMEREGGVPGRLLGWGVLEGRVPPLWEVRPDEFPLAGTILDLATGVIAHSEYVEARVREHGYDGPLWRIPHPAWPAHEIEPARVDGDPLIGCFGHVNENKRIPQLLRAFAALREKHPGARLLLVGSETPGFSLRHELPEGVIREPYVEEARLWSLMAACGAIALLRAPTMGETSGSAIRALSLGKPLLVSDLGSFAELPDEVALKVPPGGENEVPALTAALERLAEPGVAARMGEAARAYVAREHDLTRVAEQYAAALEQAAGDGIVREKVLREVAGAAAEVGLDPEPLAPLLEQSGIVSANGHAVSGHVPVSDTRTWPKGPVWLWLGALYAVAVAVFLALGERLPSPWILVDELIYGDMARSFAATGHFLLRGSSAGYAPLYPLLISPVYAAIGPVHDVYQWVKVVNALLMPSAVFPAYLLARRVVKQPAAFAAAVLAVAVPAMAFVGTVMTENLFYPIFLWLALALVLALERPTLQRQLVLLGVCVVAFEARQQGFVFFLASLTAPLLLAWIERGRPRNLKPWVPLYGIVVGAGIVVLVYELVRGQSATAILGKYSQTSSGGYHWWQAVRWLFLHVAELDLYVWVLPFAALIVLVANARHLDARLRAFAAATTALSVWLVLEVGVFASRYSLRIEDRYTFYLAPLLVISLLAWIERGQPRPPRAAVVAAGVAAALPGMIPFLGLLTPSSASDTLGLQPWWYLGNELTGRDSVGVVAVFVAVALAAAFLWLPRRWAPLLPVVVGLGFLFTWLPLELWSYSFPQDSRNVYRRAISPGHQSWIDAAVGRNGHVAVLWSGGNRLAVWENEFWNRSVEAVYDLTAPLPGNLPSTPVTIDQSTGIFRGPDGKPITQPYVLTSSTVKLRGQVVARDRAKRLVLYRVNPPARSTTTISGLYPEPSNPWSNAHPVWTRFQCSGGTLSVTVFSDQVLFRKQVQTVRVSGTTAPVTLDVPSTTPGLTFRFPLTPRNGVCRVAFSISPTRIPGHGDPRRLGLHFAEIRYIAP